MGHGYCEYSSKKMLAEVLARSVSPRLKSAGFRKSGMNYHRRLGETVQVINFQSSGGSSVAETRFYLNIGIAFDAVCALSGTAVLDQPKEYECDTRGIRSRLENLIDHVPGYWSIRIGDDVNAVAAALDECMARLEIELDSIDGLATFAAHRWFNVQRPGSTAAQVLYLLGDKKSAWREVQELATKFADRANANRVEWWLGKLRLADVMSVRY